LLGQSCDVHALLVCRLQHDWPMTAIPCSHSRPEPG
jgi:hypothetical protein